MAVVGGGDYYEGIRGQKFLAFVNVLGEILKVEGPFRSTAEAPACYGMSEVTQHPELLLSEGERIVADGECDDPSIGHFSQQMIQRQEDAKRKTTLEEFNEEVTANRRLVEEVFVWLRAKAKRVALRYRRAPNKRAATAAFTAACQFHNFIKSCRISIALDKSKRQRTEEV